MVRSQLSRSVRYTVIATALLVSTLGTFAVAGARVAALQVDLPAPDTIVANGAMIDIGGWTSGTRVDAYFDGPAGFGTGIGSALVATARPDVAAATGVSDMADAGFNLAWQPTDLSAGPHTLYVYALVDGSWMFHTVPIIGLGNAFPQADSNSNDRSDPSFDTAPSVGPSGTDASAGE